MGINGINNQQQNGYYYLNQVRPNEVQRANEYQINVFENEKTAKTGDSIQKTTNLPADGKDDGSIGFFGAVKNILKGGVKFFTNMFTDENGDFSLKQTAKTLGMIGLITAATFIPVIGPLVLPALCAYGMAEGGIHIVKGLSNAMSAQTDAEAEQAWQDVGSGTTEGVLSYVGYKATKGFKGAWEDSVAQYESIKTKTVTKPSTETASSKAETAAEEAAETVKPNTEKPVSESKPLAEAEAEVKAEAEPKAKAKAEAEAKAKAEAEAKAKAEAEAKAKAEAEAKAKAEAEAKAKAEAEAKAKAEAEAKAKAEAEAKAKAEAEAKAKAEAEPKAKAEAEPKAKAEFKEINPEEINKNISYKEEHGLKVFADERNFIIRNREYSKSQGIELPNNEKTLKLESEIRTNDDIFKKAVPLESESVVYRGYDLTPYPTRPIDIAYINMMKNAKIGDVITPDAGYTFVALKKAEIQGNYASTGVIEIRLPEGTQLVTHDGWEALLPRNASYKVLDKKIVDGKVNYVFEYILPEG